MSGRDCIGQQVYTRGREGVFRSNEGLDTAAKSPSLDPSFIKRTLHPFCIYKPPQELLQQGEQDTARYPEAFTVFHADSGEMVIGRGMFAGTDFTGQRDNIIVHQYVVPRSRKEEFVRRPDMLFRVGGFLTQYDAHVQGKVLPDLDAPVLEQEGRLFSPRELLERLDIDGLRFKQLLWSVMMSAGSGKKVFIILNVPMPESSRYAKQLMELLYSCLPYGLRHQLGFMTYHHEAQGKKQIHVMFVDKGTLRPGDSILDREYLFDFPNGRFLNAELKGNDVYLDFVWENLDNPSRLQDFYAFAEEALQGMEGEEALSVAAYYQLCVLFRTEQGNREYYEANKVGVAGMILRFLTEENVESKPRLDDLFWRLVKSEASALSQPYLEVVVSYARINSASRRLMETLLGGLNLRELAADRKKGAVFFEGLLPYPGLFASITKSLLDIPSRSRMVEDYAGERLSRVKSMEGLQKELSFWKERQPGIFLNTGFHLDVQDLLSRQLKSTENPVEDGREFVIFLQQLYESFHERDVTGRKFCERLHLELSLGLLDELDMERLAFRRSGPLELKHLEQMRFIMGPDAEELADGLDDLRKSKVLLIDNAYVLLKNPLVPNREHWDISSDWLDFYRRFDGFGERKQLQTLVKRFLQVNGQQDYEKVALIFFDGLEDGTGDFRDGASRSTPKRRGRDRDSGNSLAPVQQFGAGKVRFDYANMLEYLEQALDSKERLYSFLQWASAFPPFLDESDKLDAGFAHAVRSHFHRRRKGELRNGKLYKRIRRNAAPSLLRLYETIRLEQASGLTRYMVKNKKAIRLSAVACVALCAIGAGVILTVQAVREPSPPGAGSSPSGTPSVTAPIPSGTPLGASAGTAGSTPAQAASASPDTGASPGGSVQPGASVSPGSGTPLPGVPSVSSGQASALPAGSAGPAATPSQASPAPQTSGTGLTGR